MGKARALRILLLTQWFDPEPTFKGLVFARELVKLGFDVEVVTGFPNYPGGVVYPGYRLKWLQQDLIDEVHITRVPLYPSHDQSAIRRVMNYTSFAASSLVYCLLLAKRPDVVYAYHPPLTVGITASLMRLICRVPVVYDIQDMWPDTLRATGMLRNPKLTQLVSWVCNWVYKRVDRIAVLSPGFERLLVQRGVPQSKITMVYNWADEASLSAPAIQRPSGFPTAEKFCILFAGNIGKAQALDTVLEAAELTQLQSSNVCWVLLGGGVELDRLKAETKRRSLVNVVFLAAVPMGEVGAYLKAADVLLVHLRKDPLFQITIPSKTQAYMAVGKPLLMAVDGDAADLVRESQGGIVAESENAQALAAAALQLAKTPAAALIEMGLQAKTYYQQHLALSVGAQKFGEMFRRLGDLES